MDIKIKLFKSYNEKLNLLNFKKEENENKIKNLIVVNNYLSFELESLNYRLEFLNSYKTEIMHSREILKNFKKSIIICYPFMSSLSVIVTVLLATLITNGNIESIKNMLVISSSISGTTFTHLGIKHYSEKKKHLNNSNLKKTEILINEVNNELYLRNYKIKRNKKIIDELKCENTKINIEINEIINKLNKIKSEILVKEDKADKKNVDDINNNKAKNKIKKL